MAEHLWAWVVEEADGREGIIMGGVLGPGGDPWPAAMATTVERIARSQKWRVIAEHHAKQSGRPVRLVRFDRGEVVREL